MLLAKAPEGPQKGRRKSCFWGKHIGQPPNVSPLPLILGNPHLGARVPEMVEMLIVCTPGFAGTLGLPLQVGAVKV